MSAKGCEGHVWFPASMRVRARVTCLTGNPLRIPSHLGTLEGGGRVAQRERNCRLMEKQRRSARALDTRVKGLFASAVVADERGDRGEAARLHGEAQTAIQNAPSGVKASLKAIRDADLQATNPAAAAIRPAPKAVRGQVAQPLYTQPSDR
jgi:hypothetical protein